MVLQEIELEVLIPVRHSGSMPSKTASNSLKSSIFESRDLVKMHEICAFFEPLNYTENGHLAKPVWAAHPG